MAAFRSALCGCALASATLLLSGCDGRNGQQSLPAAIAMASVEFNIVIPAGITPKYISSSTKSASITVNGGTPIVVNCTTSCSAMQWPAASPFVTAVGIRDCRRRLMRAAGPKASGIQRRPRAPAAAVAPSRSSRLGRAIRAAKRMVADVSAVADPATGVAVYDTYNNPGWLVFGCRSVSTSIVGAAYALAGKTANLIYGSYPYAHANAVNDVITGNNGTCTPAYFCTAGPGYDRPTGPRLDHSGGPHLGERRPPGVAGAPGPSNARLRGPPPEVCRLPCPQAHRCPLERLPRLI